jgi:hypothetical protein
MARCRFYQRAWMMRISGKLCGIHRRLTQCIVRLPQVPTWVLPAIFIASGLQGTFMFEMQKKMYGVGVPMTSQSDAMGQFMNAAVRASESATP